MFAKRPAGWWSMWCALCGSMKGAAARVPVCVAAAMISTVPDGRCLKVPAESGPSYVRICGSYELPLYAGHVVKCPEMNLFRELRTHYSPSGRGVVWASAHFPVAQTEWT